MRKLLLLIPIAILIASCGSDNDDNQADVNLTLKGTYDGQPLITFEPLAYGDATIELSTSEFFIAEIELTDDAGVVTQLDTRAYIDFTNKNFDLAGAESGIAIDLGQLDKATYTKIKFGVGVPAGLNATTPDLYTSSDALNQGEHWPGWGSYIFMKQQGKFSDPNQNIEDLAFLFHLGSDEIYREVELDINFEVTDANNGIEISLDHYKLFGGDGNLFDIPSSPINHQIDSKAAMEFLANNIQSAFE